MVEKGTRSRQAESKGREKRRECGVRVREGGGGLRYSNSFWRSAWRKCHAGI